MAVRRGLASVQAPALHCPDVPNASCVQLPVCPPPPPPSPPAHPQTKMQIEKAVDILRKNKVNSDYVYVSAARLAPLPLPLPLLLPPSVPRCA